MLGGLKPPLCVHGEMEDAPGLEPGPFGGGGSSPPVRTRLVVYVVNALACEAGESGANLGYATISCGGIGNTLGFEPRESTFES